MQVELPQPLQKDGVSVCLHLWLEDELSSMPPPELYCHLKCFECVQLQFVVTTPKVLLLNLPYSGGYRILNTEFVEGCMLYVERLALAFTVHVSNISVFDYVLVVCVVWPKLVALFQYFCEHAYTDLLRLKSRACRTAVPVENSSLHISGKLSICMCVFAEVHSPRVPVCLLVCKRGCVSCDL